MDKFVYYFNWFFIVLLAIVVLILFLEPNRGGGDAATKGLGNGLITFGLGVMIIMIILNILPYRWPKYLGLVGIILAIVIIFFSDLLNYFIPGRWMGNVKPKTDHSKPIFDEPELEAIARPIYYADPGALQSVLAKAPDSVKQSPDLLWYAVNEASYSAGKKKDRVQCVRLILNAGGNFKTGLEENGIPVFAPAATVGASEVLSLLFDHGIDPNLISPYNKHSYIFDAVTSHTDPLGSVQAFVEAGVDPDVKGILEEEDGLITPLITAAFFSRWDICAYLIEKGADPTYTCQSGKSLPYYIKQEEENILKYGSSATKASFTKLKTLMDNK